ncbi:hypothetical protein HQ529_05980 [Candidatus Woesearchaeota archaeon]|nr:hypothetical protein [Candidatus Woesearchaeota archaeon]
MQDTLTMQDIFNLRFKEYGSTDTPSLKQLISVIGEFESPLHAEYLLTNYGAKDDKLSGIIPDMTKQIGSKSPCSLFQPYKIFPEFVIWDKQGIHTESLLENIFPQEELLEKETKKFDLRKEYRELQEKLISESPDKFNKMSRAYTNEKKLSLQDVQLGMLISSMVYFPKRRDLVYVKEKCSLRKEDVQAMSTILEVNDATDQQIARYYNIMGDIYTVGGDPAGGSLLYSMAGSSKKLERLGDLHMSGADYDSASLCYSRGKDKINKQKMEIAIMADMATTYLGFSSYDLHQGKQIDNFSNYVGPEKDVMGKEIMNVNKKMIIKGFELGIEVLKYRIQHSGQPSFKRLGVSMQN